MLALTRKPGQTIVISGGISMTIVAVDGKNVRLSFTAPESVRIVRSELLTGHATPAQGIKGDAVKVDTVPV